MELAKRFIWLVSKAMSKLHVYVDYTALRVRAKNMDMWKKNLLKTLMVYYRMGRKGDSDD